MFHKQLSSAVLSELWGENTDGFMPVLIDVYNPDIVWNDTRVENEKYAKLVQEQEDGHLRLINDTQAVKKREVVVKKNEDGTVTRESVIRTYLPSSFSFNPPSYNGKSVGTASIQMSAIDKRITQILRSIKIPCEVTVTSCFAKEISEKGEEIYRFYDLENLKFYAESASVDGVTATLSLTSDKIYQTQVPIDIATSDRVPGIVKE